MVSDEEWKRWMGRRKTVNMETDGDDWDCFKLIPIEWAYLLFLLTLLIDFIIFEAHSVKMLKLIPRAFVYYIV